MPTDPISQQDLDSIKQPPLTSDYQSKIEERKEYGRFKRDESAGKHLHIVLIVGIYVAFAAFVIIFAIRAVHLVLPLERYWLTEHQIQGIDKILFSGAIGGFLGRYLKRVSDYT